MGRISIILRFSILTTVTLVNTHKSKLFQLYFPKWISIVYIFLFSKDIFKGLFKKKKLSLKLALNFVSEWIEVTKSYLKFHLAGNLNQFVLTEALKPVKRLGPALSIKYTPLPLQNILQRKINKKYDKIGFAILPIYSSNSKLWTVKIDFLILQWNFCIIHTAAEV